MSRAQFASIHPGLLARKGEATPALASALSHVSYVDGPRGDRSPLGERPHGETSAQPRRTRQAEHGEHYDAGGAHHSVTLRINAEQRRRMWLASVRLGRSKQDILADALEVYLDQLADGDMKDCRCFCQTETPGFCDIGD